MALFHPLRKITCPYCFAQFHPGHCAIVSQRDGGVLEQAPTGLKRFLARFWVKRLVGAQYVLKMAARQCPECQHALPAHIEHIPLFSMALVGGVAAGKSMYLAMLVHQLGTARVLQAIGCTSFRAISGEMEERYRREYYEPLFRERRHLPVTVHRPGSTFEPLIYRLEFSEESKPRHRVVYLAFYDVYGGDDLMGPTEAVQYARFLVYMRALILLADPLAMPRMAEQIAPQYRLLHQPRVAAADILMRLIDLYERQQGKPGQQIKLPIAITVSKSDLLQFADPLRRSLLFATPAYSDPRSVGPLRCEELDMEEVVKKLLELYEERSLVMSSKRLWQARFFAVSSTGWPPDPAGLFPAIEPLRVLDPVLWILVQLGIITCA